MILQLNSRISKAFIPLSKEVYSISCKNRSKSISSYFGAGSISTISSINSGGTSNRSRSIVLTIRRYMTSTNNTPITTDRTNTPIQQNFKPTNEDKQMVQNMLYRIRECNHIPKQIQNNLMDVIIDDQKVGKVTQKVANLLCNSSNKSGRVVFMIQNENNENHNKSFLTLSNEVGNTIEQRTDAVMRVMENLRDEGIIKGWRDELLPLSTGYYNDPVLLVERAAAPFLGMQQYGVHINGLVKEESIQQQQVTAVEKMWIARRSKTKSKYPNMLDHIVAGGQPAGLGLMENVIKECAEEAGISEEMTLSGIHSTGAISYEQFEPFSSNDNDYDNDPYDGLISRSLLFNYDLYLPNDFTPKVVDGEVEEFFLWSIDEVIESMDKNYSDPIKPNCYLVIIDFLLRKGYISPEIPGYLDILKELRGGYCG